ncbi:MAG: sterol desaturase family protein [Oceanospirillaceae bacterium]|jgi:alkylglycerol monooxygenase|nr:sterol desaturase family protein [SAR92 clade bacterium]MBT4442792.1 sterol desaturase family protein [Oceanospirillaceae bacterium]MBT5796793.1 sterol desaturase family protein [Porticoccaceae bacterium]MDB9978037.1 sterol desaturase family protein [Porticoccaceae bacterium]|tara:strand:- start:58 stop:1308 length:1251 start_codon:yes stop_codon:yes gene_type:complete
MNFVPYAVPFFLLLILVELAWGWLKGNNTYRINDSLNSLSLGLLSTVTKFVFLNIGLLVFSNIGQNHALWSFNIMSTSHWLLGILLYDFLYYWYHRISHERQLFWGSHVVHHQSEDYNLSTALRQTSTSFLTTWVFFIPCFFLGMPIYMYVSIATAHLVYQFWVHTQHIGKLGFLEWFIVSPSNHRVHHAQNPDYIDKNYGGLFIVWDRLFGTFQEEDEQQKPIYGIRVPLSSWNPLWANLHIFVNMARDAWRTNAWKDKLRVLWSKTGWRPADVAQRYPANKSDLNHFTKYDPKLSTRAKYAMVGQYLLLTFFHLWSAGQVTKLPYELLWAVVIAQLLTIMVIGAVLDGKPFVRGLELSRLVVMTGILYSTFTANLISMDWLYYAIVYLVVSASLMWVCIKNESSSEAAASSDPA